MGKLINRKQINLKLANGNGYGKFNSPDVKNTDHLEEAFSKVISILDELTPTPPADLSSISIDNDGVSGKLAFGTSNPITNYNNHPTVNTKEIYNKTSTSIGIFPKTTDFTGTLADDVFSNYAYENNAFKNGNIGILNLILNGVIIHTVNLATFSSGNSFNANGSGFILSAPTPLKYQNGSNFNTFKYRTGTFKVSHNEFNAAFGYRTLTIQHVIDDIIHSTDTYSFIIDSVTNSLTFTNETINNITLNGERYLSGVKYNTSVSGTYNLTIGNIYNYTYSEKEDAITHTLLNCSMDDISYPIPDYTFTNNDNLVITKNFEITSPLQRFIGKTANIKTTVKRTINPTQISNGVTIGNFLIDNVAPSNTDNIENFSDESRRLNTIVEQTLTDLEIYEDIEDSSLLWDSKWSLTGTVATHNTGLLVYNGALQYPKIDFSTILNGFAGNPNYASTSGNRTFYRYFRFIDTAQNFTLKLTATNTLVTETDQPLSGNIITIEIMVPTQTGWKDCARIASTENDPGCYAPTYGNNKGNINGQNWGLTLFSKDTIDSAGIIVMKVTAPSSWTGKISRIELNKI